MPRASFTYKIKILITVVLATMGTEDTPVEHKTHNYYYIGD